MPYALGLMLPQIYTNIYYVLVFGHAVRHYIRTHNTVKFYYKISHCTVQEFTVSIVFFSCLSATVSVLCMQLSAGTMLIHLIRI